MRRFMVVMAVGLLAALAGCGDDGDSSSSGDNGADGTPTQDAGGGSGGAASSGEACELVSEAEVETSTGAEVVASVDLPTGCQWRVSADDPLMSYEWQEVPVEGFASNRALGNQSSSMESETITGLGDDAFLRTQMTSTGEVVTGETWVTTDDTVFFVRSSGLAWSDDMADAQRSIAELLVDRVG